MSLLGAGDKLGRMSRRATTLTVASLMLVVLVAVTFLLPVPYVTMEPGPTLDTLGETDGKPLIDFGPGVKTYETAGSLALTTVSVTRPDSKLGLAQAFEAWFDGSAAIVPRDLIYPPEQSSAEAEEETRAQMSGSQLTSEVAGLTEAGYDVSSFVEVSSVEANGPADGTLESGDQIVAVDGEPVATPDEAIAAITNRQPGDTVELDLRRNGATQAVEITTAADPDNEQTPRIGISVGAEYDVPVDVVYNVSRRIGGPSAGTMFALAIYDKLTPGPLTGGASIAGTGEIEADGTVRSIGGIQQKIAAAADDGATIFLVPAGNCEEAVGADVDLDSIQLVRISSLHDAVTSLEALDDDPGATVPACG